jgi:hypothetical protein
MFTTKNRTKVIIIENQKTKTNVNFILALSASRNHDSDAFFFSFALTILPFPREHVSNDVLFLTGLMYLVLADFFYTTARPTQVNEDL